MRCTVEYASQRQPAFQIIMILDDRSADCMYSVIIGAQQLQELCRDPGTGNRETTYL